MERWWRVARTIAAPALLAGVLCDAAADALAVVPESVEALPAGAPVEPWWLDRP